MTIITVSIPKYPPCRGSDVTNRRCHTRHRWSPYRQPRGLYTVRGDISMACSSKTESSGRQRTLPRLMSETAFCPLPRPIYAGDRQKLVGLEARSAHKRSVDIVPPEQVMCVVRFNRSPIQNA